METQKLKRKRNRKGKEAHSSVNYALVKRSMRGTGKYFTLSIIGLIIAVLSAYLIPLVTSFTIDYVLMPYAEEGYTASLNLPSFLQNWLEAVGGREFLANHLYIMAILLVLVTAINAFTTYMRRSNIAYAGEGIAKNLRDDLYTHLANVPFDYHKHVSTGDLVQRCTSDVDTVRRFIQNQLLEMVRTVIMVVCAASILISINPMLTLYSVMLMPFLTLSSFLYFRKVRYWFTQSDEAEGKLSATIQENLTGVRVVRAFGQQKAELDNFTEKNKDFKTKTQHLLDLLAFYWGASDCFGYLQIAISLCIGILFTIQRNLSVGQLLVFVSYTGMLTWPVRQLGRILADLGKATVSLGRIDEILSVPVESETGKALKPDIHGDVEFRNVWFGYEDGQDVLRGVSFKAEHGQTIAILGSTGSGKSSLVQLIQRLYTCNKGEILIDGVNVNDIERHHLRRNIGIVLQEPFLYSRTIIDNIRIVDPDASNEDVYDVARVASIHDVVSGFENGYDTIVGERGVTLSGGQKQRVAIARMLMQKAPIIILDDSMSAVDTETDAAIRDALHSRRLNSTTFIISHRITTLCKADKILVLEHGELVQQGTHEELLQQDGLYKRIANIQNMLEDEMKEDEGGEA